MRPSLIIAAAVSLVAMLAAASFSYDGELSGVPDDMRMPVTTLPSFLWSARPSHFFLPWLCACLAFVVPPAVATAAGKTRRTSLLLAALSVFGLVLGARLSLPPFPSGGEDFVPSLTPQTAMHALGWQLALASAGALLGLLVRTPVVISGPVATRLGRIAFAPARLIFKLLGLQSPVVATRGGITWSLELEEAIDLGLYLANVFEPGVIAALKTLLRPGDVVIDVGANVGAHALRMAQWVGPAGRVYAFEPTAFGLHKLTTNLALNPSLAPRLEVLHVGLTDQTQRALPEVLSASWSLTRPMAEIRPRDLGFGSSTAGARFVSLDAWVIERNLTRIDAVKLDVDGYELRVLRGARETLKRFKPVIVMEWAPHHFIDPDEPFRECIVLLQSLGYRFESLTGEPLLGDAETLERALPLNALVNVIARPR